MADALLAESLVIILASACGIALLARAGLPAVLGYLLAGWAIGPHGLQFLASSEETRYLGELGIIFLMFMVGLQFSLPTMIAARTDVFGAGSLQVGVTSLIVAAIANIGGTDWSAAIILGGAVAMSSTAVTLKQLADQGELGSQHGRLATGVLLFQDLAALPFLVVAVAWQGSTEPDLLDILHQLAVAGTALVGAAIVSRPVFRTALSWVAQTKSADLLLLASLLLALGTAFAAHRAGLAAPIGAFLAGLVVGESDFRHQVEDDVRPFRDVLLGLFFVTVGMEIDPSIVAVAPWAVVVWVVAFLPGKVLATLVVAAIMRWPAQAGIRIAVVLAHGGEFGLLLLTQAMGGGIIQPRLGQPVLVGLVLTMALAPVVRRILEAAGLPRARLLVATFDRRLAVERLLHHARQWNPALPSIVSAADDREMSELATAGASVVFPENLAAGLALAHQVLLFSGFTQDDASRVITTVRAELNPELRGHVGV
jgi:monovalent cation:H+ antiporter-2, CPA2 family